jgi:hypothetical protein
MRPLELRITDKGRFLARFQDLTPRPNIGQFFSQGTVFSAKNSQAYFHKVVTPEAIKLLPKRPHEIAKILIAEAAKNNPESAATLYIDTLPAFLEVPMLKGGITVIDILKMSPEQMKEVLSFAKKNGVTIDYHAPWMSKTKNGKYSYPTPKSHPEIFDKLTALARIHTWVYGKKPQITMHVTGKASDWKSWIAKTRIHAQVIVENSFVMRLSDKEQKKRNIKTDFDFFLHSDFHTPTEFIKFMKALGLNDVCFDQAHAFGGYRPDGRFDEMGDLKYLNELLAAGLNIARIHRASVPREFAGRERGNLVLNQIDSHGAVTRFSRQWYLQEFPVDKKLINRVFDKLNAMNARRRINVTYEILPEEAERNTGRDLETKFV